MPKPKLTFFCELDENELQALFAQPEMDDFFKLDAGLSLGLLDFTDIRAEVVRRLNQAGVPVVAWLLLPKDQGYWFNAENAPQAMALYAEFCQWTARYGLHWDGVGLDIEPDIREMAMLTSNRRSLALKMLAGMFNVRRIRRAKGIYKDLIDRIHGDGYRVDVYQIPFIADDRLAHSTGFQRMAGVVDLPAEREVLMLYSSILRPNGPGVIWSYGRQAQSIGVGSTGGGVDLGAVAVAPLSWDELARDLRLAFVFTSDVHVFSLEGCLRQGFLPHFKNFHWDGPIVDPVQQAERVETSRKAFQTVLWIMSHPLVVIGSAVSAWYVLSRIRRRLASRSE